MVRDHDLNYKCNLDRIAKMSGDKTNAPRETILELLRRIHKLQGVVDVLAEEYDLDLVDLASNGSGHRKMPEKLAAQRGQMSKRAIELRDFFATNGPAKRRVILEKTGIPVGTIGALLTEYGKKLPGGEWAWGGKVED